MISYAVSGGSVGPHYDYYDVFLLQGLGKRKWMISAKDCNLENYLSDTPLRIMKNFNEELVWEVGPGDIVYIPPKIAHHGVSLDDECLTLSIGYRSYSINEMSEALDLPEKSESNIYFKDPIWDSNQQSAEIPQIAIDAVKIFLKTKSLPDDYFGCFVTKLDSEDDKKFNEIIASYKQDQIHTGVTYELKPLCRIAYQHSNEGLLVFVNGEVFDSSNIEDEIIIDFCNTKKISTNKKNWILAKRLSSLFLIQEHQL
jgi:50S ribosomal protein L16 3-hydroxylase